jgi:hypothetical protein
LVSTTESSSTQPEASSVAVQGRESYESALAPLGVRVASADPDPKVGMEIVGGNGASGDFAIHEPSASVGRAPGPRPEYSEHYYERSCSTPTATTSRPSDTTTATLGRDSRGASGRRRRFALLAWAPATLPSWPDTEHS